MKFSALDRLLGESWIPRPIPSRANGGKVRAERIPNYNIEREIKNMKVKFDCDWYVNATGTDGRIFQVRGDFYCLRTGPGFTELVGPDGVVIARNYFVVEAVAKLLAG